MSSLVIKFIAVISMIIDHSGFIIFNNNIYMRYIGRIGFPLFAFMIVEGYNHTRNNKRRLIRYLLSILLLALFSEPIFDKLFFNDAFFLQSQNTVFTLFLGMICLIVYDKFSQFISKVFSILIVIYLAFMGEFLYLDYGVLGVLMIFGYYLVSNANIKNKYKYLLYLLVDIIYIVLMYFSTGGGVLQVGVLLSLIPIVFYNGEKGYKSKAIQYSFYLFYPIHLLILLLFKI